MYVTRALLVVTLLASTAFVAAAEEHNAKEAASKYESGMAHYHLGEWDAAVADWEAGFRAKPTPEFLYNIAQAYRAAKRPDKALQFYQSYLRMAPEAQNAEAVRRVMDQLRREVAEHPPAPADPSNRPAAAPEAATVAPAPTPTAVVAPASSPTAAVTKPAPERKKSRAWVWGVVAGAVVVAAGAVTLGVVLGTASNESRIPAVRF
jgi:tetratricopeptide (TPR) repeat protein